MTFFLGYLFLSIDQCDCFYVNIKQFLEREMGAHSSTLAWEIPWTEEPGGLQSMGLHRVRHEWRDLAAAANSFIAIACNIAWSQEVWCLLLCYSFSRLLWIFRIIFSSIKILRLFFLFLWKVPLAFWDGLHWNYGLPRWLSGKESACQFRRCGFDPCVGKIPWSREWQPAPVFLPGKFHGQRSLAGYNLWGCKDLDSTEHACMCWTYRLLWVVWIF